MNTSWAPGRRGGVAVGGLPAVAGADRRRGGRLRRRPGGRRGAASPILAALAVSGGPPPWGGRGPPVQGPARPPRRGGAQPRRAGRQRGFWIAVLMSSHMLAFRGVLVPVLVAPEPGAVARAAGRSRGGRRSRRQPRGAGQGSFPVDVLLLAR